MPVIDLRSDTVTKPTPEMRRAMAEAEVGDDVFGDDPTVIALEERAAELLGKEAGLFVASGAMGNLVAQMAHLARGEETIAGEQSHIVMDEAASHAVVVGSSIRVIRERPDGTLDPYKVRAAFRDPTDVHEPITGLVAIENANAHTMNQPLSAAYTREIAQVARDAAEVSLRERRSLVEASRPDSVGLEQNDLCDLLLTEHSLIGPDAIQRSTRHLRQLVRHRQCFDAVARPPPQIDDLCRTGLLAFRETTRHEQTFAEVGVLREVPAAGLVADDNRPHVVVTRQ